jgi:hypothetical protein
MRPNFRVSFVIWFSSAGAMRVCGRGRGGGGRSGGPQCSMRPVIWSAISPDIWPVVWPAIWPVVWPASDLPFEQTWKFWSWMVLFGSMLDQFEISFARAFVLSIFEFDTYWFIDFSTRILINRFNGLATFILSLIYINPRSRFMLELTVIFASI